MKDIDVDQFIIGRIERGFDFFGYEAQGEFDIFREKRIERIIDRYQITERLPRWRPFTMKHALLCSSIDQGGGKRRAEGMGVSSTARRFGDVCAMSASPPTGSIAASR
jgi:hypothetical protein